MLNLVNMHFEVVSIYKNLPFGLSCDFLHICIVLCMWEKYNAHKNLGYWHCWVFGMLLSCFEKPTLALFSSLSMWFGDIFC